MLVSAQSAGRWFFSQPYTQGAAPSIGAESIWRCEDNGTDEKGNNTMTLGGSAAWINSESLEGSFALSTDVASNCSGVIPSIAYGDTLSIHIPLKKYGYGDNIVLLSALQSLDGFEFMFNTSSMVLTFRTGNSTSTQTATSATITAPASSWNSFTVVVNRTAGTVLFYCNGSYVSSGSTRTDFETTTASIIGLDFNNQGDSWGYFDVPQIYLWDLTAGNVSTLHASPGTEVFK